MDKCPICASPAIIQGNGKDHDNYSDYDIDCFRCGKFNIIMWKHVYNIKRFKELEEIKLISKYQIANISGWIREKQNNQILLDEKKFKSLLKLKDSNVFEKADKILLFLANKYPIAGESLSLDFRYANTLLNNIKNGKYSDETSEEFRIFTNQNGAKILSLLALGRIVDHREFNFIWKEYLIKTKKYISAVQPRIITSEGWAYLESLRQANPDSKKAFVAMWFTDEMNEICENYIKKAAEKAGDYKAKPINDKDYNGDINDEIIGEIRNSKFVIADFTGNRGGVYYEAGFAHGLNIPVIYTCREDWFNKFVKQSIKIKDSKGKENDKELNIFSQIHFDINHHNFIIWKDGDDLYNKLLNRIKATIT